MIKKYVLFLLLLCIVHPWCLQTMEQDDDVSCAQLILCAIYAAYTTACFPVSERQYVVADSQRIQDLRSESRKVEARLKFSRKNDAIFKQSINYTSGLEVDFGHRYFQAGLRPFLYQIDLKPKRFLRYCYYQKYHNREDEDAFAQLLRQDKNCIEPLRTHSSLLAQCKKEQIEGCSALGAALLAKKISSFKRHAFMQQLIHAGFEFTQKDNLFLALYLYDTVSMREKRVMMLVLQDDEHMGHLSVLPHEVRKYIVQCMVDMFKEKKLTFLKT